VYTVESARYARGCWAELSSRHTRSRGGECRGLALMLALVLVHAYETGDSAAAYEGKGLMLVLTLLHTWYRAVGNAMREGV
jgi:hypothetical protein